MNSNHAPTAEEQLFPLEDYLQSKLAEGHNNERSVVSFRIGQLLPIAAALRENREKDARIAEAEKTCAQLADGVVNYRAKLRAVSDALDEKLQHWTPEGWPWPYYVKPEVDAIFARIRAIVEGK